MEIVIAQRAIQTVFRVDCEFMSSIHGLFEFSNEVFIDGSENQIFRREFANRVSVSHIVYLIGIFHETRIIADHKVEDLIKNFIFLGYISDDRVIESHKSFGEIFLNTARVFDVSTLIYLFELFNLECISLSLQVVVAH